MYFFLLQKRFPKFYAEVTFRFISVNHVTGRGKRRRRSWKKHASMKTNLSPLLENMRDALWQRQRQRQRRICKLCSYVIWLRLLWLGLAWHKKPTLLLNVDCQLSVHTRTHRNGMKDREREWANIRDSVPLDCLTEHPAVWKRFFNKDQKTVAENTAKGKPSRTIQNEHEIENELCE